MKKISFKVAVLATMFTLASCGSEPKSNTEGTTSVTEEQITESTTTEEETGEIEEAEADVEAEVEEETANPKYDKILDKLEKDAKKLGEMTSKLGEEYGMIDVMDLQTKMQEELNEIKVEELSRSQHSRYENIILEMTKATAKTTGGLMKALF